MALGAGQHLGARPGQAAPLPRLPGMPLTYASVAPGTVGDRRPVPSSIPRPEYVDRPAPEKYTGSEVKDAETIEKMRVAGRIAAQAMQAAAAVIAPGVTTDEIDRVGHEFLLDHGAYPSTLGYRSFPKSLCTSVNEVICHGIPDDRRLEDGDIVNIDITGYIGGVHGDTNATYLVGDVDEESRLLVERTHEAMMRGIKAALPGPPDQHHRPGHRELRQAVRLRRRPGLHRPRHRHRVPLRPGRPPLRRGTRLRHHRSSRA